MKVALHGLTTALCPLAMDIRIARETGHDGLEVVGPKLTRFLEAGYSYSDLRRLLDGFTVAGLGYVQDIERESEDDYQALLEECEYVCQRAENLGSQMVQLLTGPLDPSGAYKGLEGRPWPEIRKIAARNLSAIGDIGKRHGVSFYLEPLAFATIHRLEHALEAVDAAERENVGLVLDFWHLWDAGSTPDEVAKLDPKFIRFVHFCDSLDAFGSRGDPRQGGRGVWTGAGYIPLKLWTDAVRSTGYDGWWSCELLSPRHWELDPLETVRGLKLQLERTLD
jgi:sugar phosphate isomerase/epimerase